MFSKPVIVSPRSLSKNGYIEFYLHDVRVREYSGRRLGFPLSQNRATNLRDRVQQLNQLYFQLYKRGQYSKLSDDAKELIRNQSGLRYKAINENGLPATDIRLLAIEAETDRRSILRTKLSEYLDVPIAEDAELLDAPPERSFIAQSQLLSA